MMKILQSPGRISSQDSGVEGRRRVDLHKRREVSFKSCVFGTFAHDRNSTPA